MLFCRLHEATVQSMKYVDSLKAIIFNEDMMEQIVFPTHLCRKIIDLHKFIIYDTLLAIQSLVDSWSGTVACGTLIQKCKQMTTTMQMKVVDLLNDIKHDGEAVSAQMIFPEPVKKNMKEIKFYSMQIVGCANEAKTEWTIVVNND